MFHFRAKLIKHFNEQYSKLYSESISPLPVCMAQICFLSTDAVIGTVSSYYYLKYSMLACEEIDMHLCPHEDSGGLKKHILALFQHGRTEDRK